MQSLRTRRSGAPSASRNAPQPPVAVRSALDQNKSRVGDKIRKRMTMRYQLPSVANEVVGEIPVIPLAYGLGPVMPPILGERDVGRVREDPRAVDTAVLGAEDFDPDAYLRLKLSRSSEGELSSLRSSLEAAHGATQTDLRRNVFKNYEEFVVISKEISTLENDMLELKESLGEWKSMPELLSVDEPLTSADRRKAARSSLADLQTLYTVQLQALHSSIEGSAKHVPITPGRHVVLESPNLLELNAATYKVEKQVHFVLLDDSLLVASKRRRRVGEGGRLVADRCWGLSEVVVVDVKDTPDLTNAIKIRRGKETVVYRSEKPADKRALLAAFRQVAEDLASKKRREREGEQERRRTVAAHIATESSADAEDARANSVQADRDAWTVSEFTDDLTVAIALRDWDQSVELVERGKLLIASLPSSNAQTLRTKLASLQQNLKTAILVDLSSPVHHKTAVVHLCTLLTRLGAASEARDVLLKARSDMIRKRARTIRFEGDICLYVTELAVVTFTAIKMTSDWYLAAFKEHDMASGMVQWAKQEVETYATAFRRQVHGPDVDPRTVQESIQAARGQSKRLLQDSGLDFSFVLNSLLLDRDRSPAPNTPRPAQATVEGEPTPQLTPQLTPRTMGPAGPRPPARSKHRRPGSNMGSISSLPAREER